MKPGTLSLIIPAIALLLWIPGIGNAGTAVHPETKTQDSVTCNGRTVIDSSEITIRCIGQTMADMHYDVCTIRVKAGQRMTIRLVNEGNNAAMYHNLVVCRPEDADTLAYRCMDAGIKKGFVAHNPSLIAASKLAKPTTSLKFRFKAPAKGRYIFMDTYPGHYLMMRGNLIAE